MMQAWNVYEAWTEFAVTEKAGAQVQAPAPAQKIMLDSNFAFRETQSLRRTFPPYRPVIL